MTRVFASAGPSLAGTPEIAVIGTACRFPDAADPESFWDNLCAGRQAIRPIPEERWSQDAYFDPDPRTPGKIYTGLAALIPDADRFDRNVFSISANEARTIDPQHRLVLEVAWTALERAAISPASLAGTPTGVFVGIGSVDYWLLQAKAGFPAAVSPYVSTGGSPSVASGRLAYCLGLTGPALSVDTACSSALAAIALACDSVARGECPMAIAGGVNLIFSPDVMASLCRMRALAPDGRCKTFDAHADGYVRGEGCGIVVLKRLRDAVAAGDPVLAVIRGWAINHDGRTSGLSAPSREAQAAVIRTAIARAGVEPGDVGFVEAHGTGTALGDAIEMAALADVFSADRPHDRPLAVGSAKTNVGHLEAAAGAAGLAKVMFAVERGIIPAHLNLETPSPRIPWHEIPISVPTATQRWDPPGVRIAGISAFGFSGTNVHLVVAQATARAPRPIRSELQPDLPRVVAFSARTPKALHQRALSLLARIECLPNLALIDIALATARSWTGLACRAAFAAASLEELKASLTAFVEAAGSEDDQAPVRQAGRCAFVFPARSGLSAARRSEAMAALADLTGASDAAAAEGSSDITDGALLKALAAMWVGLGTVPVALVAAAEQVEAAEAFADEIAGIVPAPVPVLAQDRTHQGWRWLRSDGDDRRGGASLVAADIAVCLGADMPGGWSRELSEAYLDGGAEIVRCLRPDMPPQTSIGAAAASLYSKGVAIDPVRLAPREALPVILPAYPFERQRFWFDAA